MKQHQAGFTFVELLMVIMILGMLLTLGLASFSKVRERSLDQRRKTDLEDVRSALEQYRSVQSAYPTPVAGQGLNFGTSALTDGSQTYMQLIPQDPQYPKRQYHYTTSGDDYTLSTHLITAETTACQAAPGGDSCGQTGSGYGCNYCLGSYGKK